MNSTTQKDFQIEKLNKSDLNKHINELLSIDKSLVGTLEKWEQSNFLLELPEKWQLSYYSHSKGKVIGYVICSKKEHSIHIHRLAISKEFQRMNIGRSLIQTLEDYIGSNVRITLKVKKFNLDAIKFYEKNGFIGYGEEDCNYLYEKNGW